MHDICQFFSTGKTSWINFSPHQMLNFSNKIYNFYGIDLWVLVSPRPYADLSDVTLDGEDTNSILNYDANRKIPGIYGNASGAWWPKLKLMQVALPGGKVSN